MELQQEREQGRVLGAQRHAQIAAGLEAHEQHQVGDHLHPQIGARGEQQILAELGQRLLRTECGLREAGERVRVRVPLAPVPGMERVQPEEDDERRRADEEVDDEARDRVHGPHDDERTVSNVV